MEELKREEIYEYVKKQYGTVRISLEGITGKCGASASEWKMVCGVDAG